ncbi:hypothetical protein ELG72_30200 (plasmid) [Rhizobium leguminosarum]|nr:hypothetical protein [Rhizobium leguminosarum bv. viciae]TBF25809.1 hypothetical protein ELG92_30880 [Rhizobium leguminosarum]NKL23142.1 hypothetical protein [Rhizobium leguminosarum bv. viciae]NKL54458.1 hypothetical protein [Rhizobium leguminosarum bv. viciae]TBF44029.1 hypothetical protein ELG90_35150 [Rhizobium leguminosarum]
MAPGSMARFSRLGDNEAKKNPPVRAGSAVLARARFRELGRADGRRAVDHSGYDAASGRTSLTGACPSASALL